MRKKDAKKLILSNKKGRLSRNQTDPNTTTTIQQTTNNTINNTSIGGGDLRIPLHLNSGKLNNYYSEFDSCTQ